MSVIRQWGPNPHTPMKQKPVLMSRMGFSSKVHFSPNCRPLCCSLYLSFLFLDCTQCTLSFDVYHMGDYHKVIRGLLWKHSQWLYLPLSLFKGALNIYVTWSTSDLLYFCCSAWFTAALGNDLPIAAFPEFLKKSNLM